jgi:hypothetical protein
MSWHGCAGRQWRESGSACLSGNWHLAGHCRIGSTGQRWPDPVPVLVEDQKDERPDDRQSQHGQCGPQPVTAQRLAAHLAEISTTAIQRATRMAAYATGYGLELATFGANALPL